MSRTYSSIFFATYFTKINFNNAIILIHSYFDYDFKSDPGPITSLYVHYEPQIVI